MMVSLLERIKELTFNFFNFGFNFGFFRTELSYARQSLYTVKGLLYGHAKLDEKRTLVIYIFLFS